MRLVRSPIVLVHSISTGNAFAASSPSTRQKIFTYFSAMVSGCGNVGGELVIVGLKKEFGGKKGERKRQGEI